MFFVLMDKIPIEGLSEPGRIFSFERAGSVGKKVFFCGWKDSEKVLAKMRLLRSFFQKTQQRKAFYIISHYRRRWCGFAVERNEVEWKRTLERWQFAYNVDYVICCGIKALDKLRQGLEENVFFLEWGGIFNSKCKRWNFYFLLKSYE